METRTIWEQDGKVFLIDQTRLPREMVELEITSPQAMWEAIKLLRVRGAPAIGIAAALGVWVAIRDLQDSSSENLVRAVDQACTYLATSRPTAVNLFWALDRIRKVASDNAVLPPDQLQQRVLAEGRRMIDEDNEVCLAIGRHGSELLKSGDCVLTHCNAGGLATAQYGTALAVVWYAAVRAKKAISVFVDETRPLLQGARLTAWELKRANIPATLICDNMAGSVMRQGKINAVIVGTDRVAANGDFANKIGTYGVAVLAKEHGIPLYAAAPLSSVDMALPDGNHIPIEERSADEVTGFGGVAVAPDGIAVYNPAFDVTPAKYVTAFVTEQGVLRAPFNDALKDAFSRSGRAF